MSINDTTLASFLAHFIKEFSLKLTGKKPGVRAEKLSF
jgi:hypothetical protein